MHMDSKEVWRVDAPATKKAGIGCWQAVVVLLVVLRVVLSVTSRVAYRVMLVPVDPFGVLIANCVSLANVALHGGALLLRRCCGTGLATEGVRGRCLNKRGVETEYPTPANCL